MQNQTTTDQPRRRSKPHLRPRWRGACARAMLGSAIAVGLSPRSVAGPAIFDGTSTYSQDFNTMTGGNTAAAAVNLTTMTEVSGISGGTATQNGWYIYGIGTANKAGINDGSSNTGAFYQMIDSAGGRAFGSEGSGATNGFFGLVLQNTSAATINTLTLSYDAVMNRNPSTTANPFPLSFRTTAATVLTTSSTADGTFSDTAGTWSTTTLGFTTPTTGTGAPGAQAAITPMFRIGGATISGNLSGLNWGTGQYLFLRWKETDDSGSDALAGVDNFTLKTISIRNLTWNLTGGGTWDKSTANWLSSGSTTAFQDTDAVTFDKTTGGTITLAGTQAPTSVTVSAPSGTYTFLGATPADKITGPTSLTKSGAGILQVTSANDFTGGVSIVQGTLQIDGGDRLGTGGIAINGGTLKNAASSAIVLPNDIAVGPAGGTIDTGAQNITVASMSSLSGLLTKSGAGNLTVTGAFSPGTGGVAIGAGNLVLGQASGVVKLGVSGAIAGNLVLNGPIRLDTNDGAVVSGTGQIQVVTSGTLLSNTSGNVGGTISVPIVLNVNNSAFTPGSWTGSTYTPGSFTTTIGATQGPSTPTPTLGSVTINGVISGLSDVDVSNNSTTGGGGGTLILNSANAWTGTTTINANTPAAPGTASIRLGVNNAIPIASGVVVGTKTGSGAAILDLNGFNQQVAYVADGANATAAKLLTITNEGAADSVLKFTGSVTPGAPFGGVIKNGTTAKISLVKDGSNTQILSGPNTYTGTTTVNGGTLLINGSITSATAVNGSLNGGNNGATVGGSGTIAGPVTVQPGARLSPGTSGPGVFTVAELTMTGGAATSFLMIDLNGTNNTVPASAQYDQVIVSGTTAAALGGSALVVNDTTYAPAAAVGDKFWIVDAASGSQPVSGNFTVNGLSQPNNTSFTSTAGVTYLINYNVIGDPQSSGNDVVLTVTSVPEPTTGALSALGLGFLFTRRRRG